MYIPKHVSNFSHIAVLQGKKESLSKMHKTEKPCKLRTAPSERSENSCIPIDTSLLS